MAQCAGLLRNRWRGSPSWLVEMLLLHCATWYYYIMRSLWAQKRGWHVVLVGSSRDYTCGAGKEQLRLHVWCWQGAAQTTPVVLAGSSSDYMCVGLDLYITQEPCIM